MIIDKKPPLAPIIPNLNTSRSKSKKKNSGPNIRFEEIDENERREDEIGDKKERRGFFESTIVYEEKEITNKKSYSNEVKAFKASDHTGFIEPNAMRAMRALDKQIMSNIEEKKSEDKQSRIAPIIPKLKIQKMQDNRKRRLSYLPTNLINESQSESRLPFDSICDLSEIKEKETDVLM